MKAARPTQKRGMEILPFRAFHTRRAALPRSPESPDRNSHAGPPRPFFSRRASDIRAFTIIELLVIASVLILLLALLVPRYSNAKRKAQRISCVSNLKNIGLAFRLFGTGSSDQFPMDVTAREGGSKDFINDPTSVWRHFLALSNGLSAPGLVYCPSDKQRGPAMNWQSFGNQNVSYFVSLTAKETDPQDLLSGDRHLTIDGRRAGPGIALVTPNSALGWTRELHRGSGNILEGDGSVQQMSNSRMRPAPFVGNLATNRLVIP